MSTSTQTQQLRAAYREAHVNEDKPRLKALGKLGKAYGLDLDSISPYLGYYRRLGHNILSPAFTPPEVRPLRRHD